VVAPIEAAVGVSARRVRGDFLEKQDLKDLLEIQDSLDRKD